MKSKLSKVVKLPTNFQTSTKPEDSTADEYSPLEGAKISSMMSTILGKPKSVAQAYKEIIEFQKTNHTSHQE